MRAAGRRERARAADRSGARSAGTCPRRMRSRDEQGRAQADRPYVPLRRARPSTPSTIKLDKEPAIKTPDQYKFIGKPMARLDMPLKINGSAKFGIDLEVPDMVHAAIMACPVFGGTAQKSVDECDDRRAPRRDPGGEAPAMRWRWWPTVTGAPRRRSTSLRSSGRSARPARPTARSSAGRIIEALTRKGGRRASRRQCRCRDAWCRQGVRGDL